MSTHRFRPRYGGVAWTAVGIGGSLAVVGAIAAVLVPVAAGAAGVVAGVAYLASPTWRMRVVVDDEALRVVGRRGVRFELRWPDVVKVIASPAHHACFVDGGAPEQSLLVPGEGAPAPYDLEDRPALFDAILARVPEARIERVASLEDVKTRS